MKKTKSICSWIHHFLGSTSCVASAVAGNSSEAEEEITDDHKPGRKDSVFGNSLLREGRRSGIWCAKCTSQSNFNDYAEVYTKKLSILRRFSCSRLCLHTTRIFSFWLSVLQYTDKKFFKLSDQNLVYNIPYIHLSIFLLAGIKVKKLATSGNRTRASRVAGENSTTEPTLLVLLTNFVMINTCRNREA